MTCLRSPRVSLSVIGAVCGAGGCLRGTAATERSARKRVRFSTSATRERALYASRSKNTLRLSKYEKSKTVKYKRPTVRRRASVAFLM